MRRRLLATAFAAVVFLVPSFGQAATQPPVEAFGSLPFVSDPKLSPDGKYIAVLQPYKGLNAAVVFKAHPEASDTPVVMPGSGEVLIDGLVWAKNDRLVLITTQNKPAVYDTRIETWIRAIAVDPDGKNPQMLLKNMPTAGINGSSASIIDVNLDDPDHILMSLVDENILAGQDFNSHFEKKNEDFYRLDLIEADVRSGKATIDIAGNVRTSQWIADGHGNALARIDQTSKPLQDHLIVHDGSSWKEIGVFDASEDRGAGIQGPSEDQKALVQLAEDKDGYWALARLEMATGSASQLYAAHGYDVSGAITDEWNGEVIGARYIADKPEDVYFDPSRQALQSGIEKAFPGMTISIVSWSRAKDVVLFSVEDSRDPPTYYLLDRNTHQTATLATAYPNLKQDDLGEMKVYNYVARDGLAISAYLTLPPGKQPKNLPVVVMPHGGPDARDYLGFDWWVQFLANRGYAVLQPNYRGSSGFGRKFTESGRQQWGLKMQDDVTDGVKKLIADGIADPKRICIVGASYGGYSALAGAAFTPDLYACAVSYAGVSDLPQQIHETFLDAGNESQLFSFWGSRIGSDDIAKLAATSPDKHADAIKCPVLLMHGEGDTTVRITQSEMMADALQAAGKNVEFIRFPGEDHYLRSSATRIRVLREVERFLKKYIGQ